MAHEAGYAQHVQGLDGPWQVQAQPFDHDPTELLDANWIAVPECAHLQTALYPDQPYWGEHLHAINTQAWIYRRTFTVPDIPFRRARLRFDGVDYFAEVWLNDRLIGKHEGHFDPFEFDITDGLNPDSDNELMVRVTAPWDKPEYGGFYPTDHVLRGLVKGIYEHGDGLIPPDVNPIGIWRKTFLLLDNGVSVDQIHIDTALDGRVNLRLKLTNATGAPWTGSLRFQVTAENHDGPGLTQDLPLSLDSGAQTVATDFQISEPRLWWSWDQGEPNLYQLSAELHDSSGREQQCIIEIFGLRTVRLDRRPDSFTYYLNERPIYLRGSSYMPGLYLSACTAESLSRDVQLAREANLNTLRLHIHVSPPELYDLCDRAGMLLWQDFELNWIHDPSPAFEARAVKLQHAMIDNLYNHPAIMTWCCHNEPTMLLTRRQNYEQQPDPALYRAALEQDPSRPVFMSSGQMDDDWQQSGDSHIYLGAIWTRWYTDVYRYHYRLATEFGFDAPADSETLKTRPELNQVAPYLSAIKPDIWAHQATFVQFYIEHLRRLRASGCAGYIHFWLADLYPQVGCGVLDSERRPKGGYAALALASQPLHVAMEHNGRYARALWIFNDTLDSYPAAQLQCKAYNHRDEILAQASVTVDVTANQAQRVSDFDCPRHTQRVELILRDASAAELCRNHYDQPLKPLRRPPGYPWKIDATLGFKIFDHPQGTHMLDEGQPWVPMQLKERVVAWVMSEPFSLRVSAIIARQVDRIRGIK